MKTAKAIANLIGSIFKVGLGLLMALLMGAIDIAAFAVAILHPPTSNKMWAAARKGQYERCKKIVQNYEKVND